MKAQPNDHVLVIANAEDQQVVYKKLGEPSEEINSIKLDFSSWTNHKFSFELESGTISKAYGVFYPSSETWTEHFLPLLMDKLTGGGQCCIEMSTDQDQSSIMMALMIAGFVDTKVEACEDPALSNWTNCFRIAASKPAFESGEAATLTSSMSTKSKWKVVTDGEKQEDELIDEDDLLGDEDEDLVKSSAAAAAASGSCAPKRRACADCHCGRKEQEEKDAEMTEEQEKEMTSACGNCFKGDAFRCAGCPMLGKPSFKPGMGKVVLNLDNTDDF